MTDPRLAVLQRTYQRAKRGFALKDWGLRPQAPDPDSSLRRDVDDFMTHMAWPNVLWSSTRRRPSDETGRLVGGEVNVRIWIHPDHRKKGYRTALLRKARSDMAWRFPAVPLVVRTPAAKPALCGLPEQDTNYRSASWRS